jgi:hypothetical protein
MVLSRKRARIGRGAAGITSNTANQKPLSRTNAAPTRFASAGRNAFASVLMVTLADSSDEFAVARVSLYCKA